MTRSKTFAAACLTALLCGCSGSYSGDPAAAGNADNSDSHPAEGGAFEDDRVFFAARVQPRLDSCRSCHVPGGVAADTEFLLTEAADEDYDNFKAAWRALGGTGTDPEAHPILTNNAGRTEHSGGANWRPESDAYNDVLALLTCWADGACSFSGDDGDIGEQPPLLGSSNARSFMTSFCEGRPDGTTLPQDPRELVRPGIDEGKAVAFNAYWQNCTAPADNPRHRPETCGEFRARVEAGRELVHGDLVAQNHGEGQTTAEQYNSLWEKWGMNERPSNFDAMVRERYGLPKASFDNPYPLPGENPNATDGGSGQLPAGLAQVKDANDDYTGTIGITCDVCHSGDLKMLGDDASERFVTGLGAHTTDFQLLMTDLAIPLPLGFNDSRGVTNAEGLSGLLVGLVDIDSLGFAPETTLLLQVPGNTSGAGDTKMPAWWNASHRPRKFWDGGLSYDAARLDSAILNLFKPLEEPSGTNKAFNREVRDKIEAESLKVQAYIESLESPRYPGEIDTELARQGAVLFHNKNLWADDANPDIPRPPTNGSCAGCHGVYSPRYAQNPDFLEDPGLKGIAGYVAPLDQIGTDPERLKGFTEPLLELMSTSWFSYPEAAPNYIPPDQKNPTQERLDDLQVFTPGARPSGACTWQGFEPDDQVGYLAPPLHGVWATAPYLHNGSVPDVWGILDPESRPDMWRRMLSDGVGAERDFATTDAAYDHERLGWRYETLSCADNKGIPYQTCEPAEPVPVLTQMVEFVNRLPGSLNSLGYQVRQPIGRRSIEARKIFNTHRFAKSNEGHAFTKALTDAERRALIEYLKTL